MADQREYLYSLVRYVPDVVRGEFVNIGALVRDPENADIAKIRFTTDWSRLQALYPEVDVELLDALGQELSTKLSEPPAADAATSLLQTMLSSWSNGLQLSELKVMRAESIESGLERLLHLYVRPPASWSPQIAAGAS